MAPRKDVYAILVATTLPGPRHPHDTFIPASRLADALGIDTETVYRASQRGELPPMSHVPRSAANGRQWTSFGFDLDELAAWQEQRPEATT